MVAQRRLGGVRVVVGDGRHDGTVFGDHPCKPASAGCVGEAEPAHAIEVPVGAPAERPRDLAPAELAEGPVQRLVEAIERLGVAVGLGPILGGEVGLKLLQLTLGGALGRQADGAALERLADEGGVGDGVVADQRGRIRSLVVRRSSSAETMPSRSAT